MASWSLSSWALLLFRAAQRNDLAGVVRELEKQKQFLRFVHLELQLALRVAVKNDCVSVVLHMRRVFETKMDLLGIATRSGSVQVFRSVLGTEQPFQLAHVNFCLDDACRYGQKVAAQYLVTYKAVVSPQGTEFTPLYCAAHNGRVRVVMWLLQTKALVKPPWLAGARLCWGRRQKFIVRLLERALQVNGRVKPKDL